MGRRLLEIVQDRATRHVAAIIAASLAIYVILLLYHIAPYQYNPTCIIRFGASNPFFDPSVLEPGTVVFSDAKSGGDGYDGQFYYYTIKHILMKEKTIPNPFRFQRILYPFFTYVLSAGQAEWFPISMLAVNLLAISLSTVFLWILIRDSQIRPEYLLLYALNIGFLVAVFYDVATPLCVALTVMAGYYFHREKWWLTSAMLALSLLAHETGSIVLAALGAWLVLKKNCRGCFILATAIVPWAIWQTILWYNCGTFPLLMSGHHFSLPFAGMISQIASCSLPGGWMGDLRELSVYPFMAFVIALLIASALELKRRPTAFLFVLLVHALVGICFNREQIWSSTITSSARTLATVFPFVIICYSGERSTYIRILIWMSALLTLMGIARILLMPVHPFYVT